MKKKIICLMLMLFMLCAATLSLTACVDAEITTGTYITDDGMAWVVIKEDNTFMFNRHIATSYRLSGNYNIINRKLTLHNSEADKYIFDIKDGRLVFKNAYLNGKLINKNEEFTGVAFKPGTVFTLKEDHTG